MTEDDIFDVKENLRKKTAASLNSRNIKTPYPKEVQESLQWQNISEWKNVHTNKQNTLGHVTKNKKL